MRGNALGAAIRNGACAVPIVLSALLLAAGTARSQGPLRVSAYLSADTVPAGDIVVLQIVAETDGPAPDIVDPRLPAGLDIVGRSDRTEIQFSFPANRIRTLRRELAIRASAPGEYRIPPVRVTAGNAERETAAVTLFVSGPVATAAASGIDGIVLQAALSADTVFVSEQVTLRTDVLVADDARSRLRGSPEYTPPDASGFWLHEVPRDPPRILIRDGRRFEVQSFARAYFPITPGEYTIPPARLVYETRDAFMAASARHELTTDTFRVVVLPVPDEGRPEGFTGAVGRFEIGAAVEPTDVVAGDPVALTITVAGTGNLRGLPPPELPALRGTEVYPPTEETSVDFIDGAVRGTKRFTWIVVPEIAGPLQVPPVEYHYFDPETRTFEVARSEPLAITVRGSPGRVASLDSGVRPARRIRSSEPPLHWVRSPAFAALQALPLVALLWGLWRRNRGPLGQTASPRMLRSARGALTTRLAGLAAGDADVFLNTLNSECRAWLAGRLGDPAIASAPVSEIRACLESRGVATDVARGMAEVLQWARDARYAPAPPDSDQCRAAAARVATLIHAVDRQARHAPATSVARAALVLAIGLAAAPSAVVLAAPQADVDVTVEDAMALLDDGDGRGAARALIGLVERSPDHHDLWYDLGVACHAAGEPGCATWAWLVALRLQPRDADARHNLQVLGTADDVIRRVTPPIPISTEGSLLVASVAWFVAASAFVVGRLKHARAGTITGIAALAGAVMAVANAAGPALRSPAAVLLDGEAVIHNAPNLRAGTSATLPGGAVLRIVDVRGRDWARVATDAGDEGWIESTRLAHVRPHAVVDVAAALRRRL